MWRKDAQTIKTTPSTLTVQIDGTLDSNATSTFSNSPDGFIAWDDFTVSTSSGATVGAVYTNTGSPLMCDGGQGALYFNSLGFSPTITASLGTSTSATTQTGGANLLASTTVATTTDKVSSTLDSAFVLGSNESIVGLLGDVNSNSSSTNFSNWEIEFGIHCWTLGQ